MVSPECVQIALGVVLKYILSHRATRLSKRESEMDLDQVTKVAFLEAVGFRQD